MLRNQQMFDLVYTSYTLWSKQYDDEMRGELFDKTAAELCRLTEKKIQLDTKHYIEFLHTTDYEIPYRVFYDGDMIEDEKYILGYYLVKYTDGTEEKFDVKYGQDISGDHVEYNLYNAALIEMLGRTKPIELDGKMYYRWRVSNPHPEKAVDSIQFCSMPDKNAHVFSKSISVINHLK